MSNKLYLSDKKAKNISETNANYDISYKIKQNCSDHLLETNNNKSNESKILKQKNAIQKIDTLNSLCKNIPQKSYCPAPHFRSHECPHLGFGSRKTEFLKTNSFEGREGPQNSEKTVKKLPKKIYTETIKCENPPHIVNSPKDFVARKESGGGRIKCRLPFSQMQ